MQIFLKFVHDNPVEACFIVAGVAQIASAMPSPTLTGFTSTWGYKWAFGVIHSLVALPRLIITMFPQFAWIFGTNAAARELQATDKKNLSDMATPPDPPVLINPEKQ